MRAFNYRSICAFSYIQKPKFMILTHTNSFSQYSFLGLNLSDINSTFAAVWSQAQSPPLVAFMKVLNQHRYVIQHAQNNDYTHRQLTFLQRGQKPECTALNKYQQELAELKDKYSVLCDHIQSHVNKQNLFLWLEVCQKLDIIESTLWNRIFSIIIQNFDSYNFQQQNDIMRYTHRYIKGKFISFTYVPAKFVYRENYLVDITNFRALFRLFVNWIVKAPNDNPDIKLDFLEKNNDLIEKISKIYTINFSEMAMNYNKNKSWFEQMAKEGTTEMLIEVLRYLSIIGMYDKDFYTLVQDKISEKWSKQKPVLTQKIISRLLAAWANVYHHNEFIFSHFIKPFIEAQIANGSQSRHHSVWLFNIAACNIRDFQFLQRFNSKILNDLPLSNKYLHITSHYLAVSQDSKRTDAFPSCSQNPFTQKILQRHGKSHHNCMNRLKEEAQQDQSKVTVTNDSGRQDNTSEHLWVYIARKAFEILSKRYPHKDNCFYTNFSFCVFQLDAILMLRGLPITFEWEGSHYKMKEGSQKSGKAQGKKLIKQTILRGYGIHILDISSTNYVERNISSFGDKTGGIKYIVDRLEKILKDHA